MARKPDRELVDILTQVTDFDSKVISALASAGARVNLPDRWSVMSEKKLSVARWPDHGTMVVPMSIQRTEPSRSTSRTS